MGILVMGDIEADLKEFVKNNAEVGLKYINGNWMGYVIVQDKSYVELRTARSAIGKSPKIVVNSLKRQMKKYYKELSNPIPAR